MALKIVKNLIRSARKFKKKGSLANRTRKILPVHTQKFSRRTADVSVKALKSLKTRRPFIIGATAALGTSALGAFGYIDRKRRGVTLKSLNTPAKRRDDAIFSKKRITARRKTSGRK